VVDEPSGAESKMSVVLDLRIITRALGGEVSGRQVLTPGPGHTPRDRSLSIKIEPAAPDGFLVHSFAGDDPIVCKDHVRRRLGLPEWKPGDEQDRRVDPARVRAFDRTALNRESIRRPRSEDELARIEYAQLLWGQAENPRGTAVEKYLQARCLDLDDDLAGGVLRFDPRTPWRDENTGKTKFIPCMIAAFRSIDDGIITAVHRIRVDQPERWPKTERRMLGVVHRAAVMLDPIGPNLAIGEGVETCMAARKLGIRPTWALGSVGCISGFPVIDGVEQLTVLSESGQASADAVKFCARRWRRAGRRVHVAMPDIGSDLNDELMAQAQ
jgi:putative DNA primase/helicase